MTFSLRVNTFFFTSKQVRTIPDITNKDTFPGKILELNGLYVRITKGLTIYGNTFLTEYNINHTLIDIKIPIFSFFRKVINNKFSDTISNKFGTVAKITLCV